MIFTGFHPNIYKKDVGVALSFLLLPWKWSSLKKGPYIAEVENYLKNYFATKYAITFDSGRTALQKALEALDLQAGDEVLVQSYTCLVVSNAINWSGAKPIYVDVADDFNMDYLDLQKKISNKSKVLIIQHTFGKAANLKKLLQIAKENNLIVIEDCAHSFGSKYEERLTGTFGDIAMFSFGSDKVISSSRGGALITNNDKIAQKIISLSEKLKDAKTKNILQNLANFPIFYISKKIYDFGLGKGFLALAQKFGITGKIIYLKEKTCQMLPFYPAKYANALAKILLGQFEKLAEMNKHRQEIAKIYDKFLLDKRIKKPEITEDNIFLRYTILIPEPKRMLAIAKKNKIILGNWYDGAIVPNDKDVNISKTGYINGSCKNAEELALHSINLPTDKNITYKKAKKISDLINNNL